MTWLKGVLLVAGRELRERARSKAYIISTLFTVLIVVGAIVIPSLIGGGPSTYDVGLVGTGGQEIIDTANQLAKQRAGSEPADHFDVHTYDTAARAEAAVKDGTIDAAIVNGTEMIVGHTGAFGGSSAPRLLQQAASTARVQDLVSSNEEAANVVEILGSEPLAIQSVSGETESEQNLRGAIAFGGLIIMYIAVLTYGQWMLSGVTEEKTNRVVEVLLSTLRPWQIFAGKLIGIGTLGIGQLIVLVAMALGALRFNNSIEIPALPVDSVVALIGWFILGFLLYATIFGAAGSLVSRMEDAQNAAAPLSILAVIGYLFSFTALNDPGGTVSLVGTFIPFTAPYVAPIRLAFGEISGWEMALAVLVTVVTIVIMIRLAGQVYAGGILRFGSRVKWREAFRAAE
ncbi:MAG: ABC transporter permease [Acidimicrobiia bacterium]